MNINNINVGDTIWFSKQGGVGQIRVTEIDKENGTLKYKTSDNKEVKTKVDNNFYINPQDAFNAAQQYNNLYVKGVKQGMMGLEIEYNTPQEIENKQIKQMILD